VAIGGIAASQRLLSGVSERSNEISVSPFLLQMAQLVGHMGLSPAFFLQDSGLFSSEPSVDLRTLLLFQAGLIKLPLQTKNSKSTTHKDEQVPSLLVPEIPEPRLALNGGCSAGGQGEAPLPSVASAPLPDPDAERSITGGRHHAAAKSPSFSPSKTGDLLSIDVTRLVAEADDPTRAKPPRLIDDHIPHLAMALPGPTKAHVAGNPEFRLWTWSAAARAQEQSKDAPASADSAAYAGSFMIATRGAITAIHDRIFEIGTGRILASNAGGDMIVQTKLGNVVVKPGTSAIVEVTDPSPHAVLKVSVLESQPSATVAFTPAFANRQSIELSQGEQLVAANRAIADSDLSGLQKDPSVKDATIARGALSLINLAQQEPLLQAADSTNAERSGAVAGLKHKLESVKSAQ
jgi:hypothetical protein